MHLRCLGLIHQSEAGTDCGPVLDGVKVLLSGAEVGNGAQECSCRVFVTTGKTASQREQLAG